MDSCTSTSHFVAFYYELDDVINFDDAQLQDSSEYPDNASVLTNVSQYPTDIQPFTCFSNVSSPEDLVDLFSTSPLESSCSSSSPETQLANDPWLWHEEDPELKGQEVESWCFKSSPSIEEVMMFQLDTISDAAKSPEPRSNTGEAEAPKTCTLRTASQKSKNKGNRKKMSIGQDPEVTSRKLQSMNCHNKVEKKYRLRLNQHFLNLLNALPNNKTPVTKEHVSSQGHNTWKTGENDVPVDFKFSKGQVLEMARKYIETLEQEKKTLEKEKSDLSAEWNKIQGVS